MAWWDWMKRGKKHKQKHSNFNSAHSYIQQRNEAASEYTQAMEKLKTKDLSPEDRYRNLTRTYRSGKDLIVVPTSWMGRDIVVNCPCKKIYVDTPLPSIVRVR